LNSLEAKRAEQVLCFKKSIDEYCNKTEGKNGTLILSRQGFNDYRDIYFAEELTKLYSIRAHARGRIHRTSAKLTWSEWNKLGHQNYIDSTGKVTNVTDYLAGLKTFTDTNGKIKFNLTLADQATYLGDSWKQYEYKAEEENVVVTSPSSQINFTTTATEQNKTPTFWECIKNKIMNK